MYTLNISNYTNSIYFSISSSEIISVTATRTSLLFSFIPPNISPLSRFDKNTFESSVSTTNSLKKFLFFILYPFYSSLLARL